MKLDHLPIGARFCFRGQILTKTGPMTAAGEKGGQVLIPKSAVLQPVPGEPAPPAPADTRRLPVGKVRAAFEAYHATAMALADEAGRRQLTTARTRFLQALGAGPAHEGPDA